MKIRKSKIQNCRTIMLMVVGALVWILSCGNVATAGYTDSAHGNSSDGVNRSGIDYPTGDCAHCHDLGSSCGEYQFMLFYDDVISVADMLCFTCHSDYPTWQPTTNYPYGITFGGLTSLYYEDIEEQFNHGGSAPAACGSRHNLGQIYLTLINPAVDAWGFNDEPNPCVACHPPHAAQRNHPVADVSGGGKLNTAIRRPSHYKSTDPKDFLWGDDDNRPGEPERMDEYAASVGGTYQAPYYADTTGTKFEPSGNASPSDGSDLPNYVTFCMDCHQYPLTDPDNGGAAVKAIKWDGADADIHGAAHANTCDGETLEGTLRAPYVDTPDSNYILSCLDCHEPHGTYKRLHLIRRYINGEEVVEDDPLDCESNLGMGPICARCHDSDHSLEGGNCDIDICHGSGIAGGFHGGKIGHPEDCEGKPGF